MSAGGEGVAAYKRLAAQLRRRIADGEFRPGDRLPTNVELAEQTGLTRVTVQQAIKLLKAEGVVETRRGGGTVVPHRHSPVGEVLLSTEARPAKRAMFYGLTAAEVWQGLREVAMAGGRLPDEVHVVEATRPTLTPDETWASLREKAAGSQSWEAQLAALVQVHEADVVPGYRLAVLDDVPMLNGRVPVVLTFGASQAGGSLGDARPGASTSAEARAVRAWVESQLSESPEPARD